MMQNREIQRAWIECLDAGAAECDFEVPAIQNMTRFLMKAPEHTWGIPGISGWGGGDAYEKSVLQPLLNTTAFLDASSTWAEQRFFNELAIRALEYANHPLAPSVRQRVSVFSNVQIPSLNGYTKLAQPFSVSETDETVTKAHWFVVPCRPSVSTATPQSHCRPTAALRRCSLTASSGREAILALLSIARTTIRIG